MIIKCKNCGKPHDDSALRCPFVIRIAECGVQASLRTRVLASFQALWEPAQHAESRTYRERCIDSLPT